MPKTVTMGKSKSIQKPKDSSKQYIIIMEFQIVFFYLFLYFLYFFVLLWLQAVCQNQTEFFQSTVRHHKSMNSAKYQMAIFLRHQKRVNFNDQIIYFLCVTQAEHPVVKLFMVMMTRFICRLYFHDQRQLRVVRVSKHL